MSAEEEETLKPPSLVELVSCRERVRERVVG